MKMKRMLSALALGAAATVAIAGCSTGAGDTSAGGSGKPADKTIKIAVFNGWDEGIAASELWKAVLEEKGYKVELKYAEPAVVYAALAKGDYDLTLDTWLPITHESYIKRFGKDLKDLGAWNDEAKLTIAVNKDAPIDSLDELAAKADLFDNRLVGIEAGAGLTKVTKEQAIPKYGLDKMKYVVSSTPAMLSELKQATAKGKNIAVTLWRPHWAYNEFPVKDLKDPKGAMGEAEGIHGYARKGFDTDQAEAYKWLSNFKMDSDTLYSLENAMFNKYDGKDYGPVVKKWMSENKDFVDGLTK